MCLCVCALLALPRRELRARSPVQDTVPYGFSLKRAFRCGSCGNRAQALRQEASSFSGADARELWREPGLAGRPRLPSGLPPALVPVRAPELEMRGSTSSRGHFPSPSRAGGGRRWFLTH